MRRAEEENYHERKFASVFDELRDMATPQEIIHVDSKPVMNMCDKENIEQRCKIDKNDENDLGCFFFFPSPLGFVGSSSASAGRACS